MELMIGTVEVKNLPETQKNEIDKEVDRIIELHKKNRYEINRLVFESVSALTESENYSNELNSQTSIQRFWGGITGKNKKLQQNIDHELAKAQYASQRTLQKLAEQNLMSFELIAAVNNKLNSSIIEIESEINKVYGTLITFFKQTRSDLVQLENRVDRLERNVNLLNWQNSIQYQMWNGIEYSELDTVSQIVCIVKDFCEITKLQWTTSDLLLLKSALASIGISSKDVLSYKLFIDSIVDNNKLLDRLFEKNCLNNIEKYPDIVPLAASVRKKKLLMTTEKNIVETVGLVLCEKGVEVNYEDITSELLEIFERRDAKINCNSSLPVYDFILEILFNIVAIDEIHKNESREQRIKEAENLFSIYDTERLFPLLEELISKGIVKAKYIMALLCETGCIAYPMNEELCEELLNQCIEAEYLPAKVHSLLKTKKVDDRFLKEIPSLMDDLIECADVGDMFACEELARVYLQYDVLKIDKHDAMNKAIYYFEKAPLVLRYYHIALRYEIGDAYERDYLEAISFYKKSASMGYGLANYRIAELYNNMMIDNDDDEDEDTEKKIAEYYAEASRCACWGALEKIAKTAIDVAKKAGDYDIEEEPSFFIAQVMSESGITEGYLYLGLCYEYGRGTDIDLEKAKEYYEKAADEGNNAAKRKLREF